MKRDTPSYHGYGLPPAIISHAVWLDHRCGVGFRDVVAQRASRCPTKRSGCGVSRSLGDTWHLDEVFVTIQGQRRYLWRDVDQDGDVLDILVQSRRDCRAARHLFRKLLTLMRQKLSRSRGRWQCG